MDSNLGEQAAGAGINVPALVISLAILFIALCCGPFYAALQFQSLREKTLQERSTNFAVQWRAQNPINPFENAGERIGKSWKAWNFKFSGLPKEFNGLSTETFQSPEPVITLNSCNLQEINFNPLIGSRRKPQSVQCLLPLMRYDATDMGFKLGCHYFEVSILSYRPSGNKKKTVGGIEGNVAIGLATRPAPPFRMPGHDAVSIGFHSKGGQIFMGEPGEGHSFGSPWNRIGATVGCGYDVAHGVVFFTQNGGPPKLTTFQAPDNVSTHLFPTIGADCDVTVVVNMGQHGFHSMPVIIPTGIVKSPYQAFSMGDSRSVAVAIYEEEASQNCSHAVAAISKQPNAENNMKKVEDQTASASIDMDKHVQISSVCDLDKEVQTSVPNLDKDVQISSALNQEQSTTVSASNIVYQISSEENRSSSSVSNICKKEQAVSTSNYCMEKQELQVTCSPAPNIEKEEPPSAISIMELKVEKFSSSATSLEKQAIALTSESQEAR